MPRASIFAHQQPPEEIPAHQFSKSLIPQLLALRHEGKQAVVITDASKRILRIAVPLGWHEIKQLLTKRDLAVKPKRLRAQKLNPANYHTMFLQAYPEPDRASMHHPHQAFVDSIAKTASNAR